MAIPKRIILSAKTRKLSRLERGCEKNMRLLHPDWEIRFFDDEEARQLVVDELPEFLAVYDAFTTKIQRVDFFRYLAVYRLGGFYFDLDVLLTESLLPLTEHACVFPFEWLTLSRYLRQHCRMDWDLGNYAFGATPGHPFLRAIIDNCIRAQKDRAWVMPMMRDIPSWLRTDFWTLNSTGPGLVTRTFAENPGAAKDVEILFPEDVCSRDGWFCFGNYGLHLMVGSWRKNQRFIPRTCERWWKFRRMREGFAESVAKGPRRSADVTLGVGATAV